MVNDCGDNLGDNPRAYLAAPLFSEAERAFNIYVAEQLERYLTVYLPQRDGGLMSEMVASGIPSCAAAKHVFQGDMDAIRKTDYLIAILDGRVIDEGVAFELGVAFSYSKRCVGLQTDPRRLAEWGNNPMITGALESEFESVDTMIQWIEKTTTIGPVCVSQKRGQFTITAPLAAQ